jgi:lauroyl/myristoyl acyltransferase
MPRFFKGLRYSAESCAVRAAAALVPLLPRSATLLLARGAGSAAFHLLRDLRRVAEANYAVAFPDADDGERRLTVRRSFVNSALVGLDLFWTRRINAGNVRRKVRFVREDLPHRLLEAGRGVIAITPHLGNWEMAAYASGLIGLPVRAVVHPLNNPRLTDWFDRHRSRGGVTVIRREGAARAALATLRRGEGVALLIDQNTKPAEGGVFVDFFGLPATITRAPAVLAHRTGAAILVVVGLPTSDGGWKVRYGPEVPVAIDADPDRAIDETTRRCARAMEDEVRSRPDLWLWMYKRWKYKPAADAKSYPFYADKVLQERTLPR